MTVCLGLGLPAMLSLAISLQPSETLMQPSSVDAEVAGDCRVVMMRASCSSSSAPPPLNTGVACDHCHRRPQHPRGHGGGGCDDEPGEHPGQGPVLDAHVLISSGRCRGGWEGGSTRGKALYWTLM